MFDISSQTDLGGKVNICRMQKYFIRVSRMIFHCVITSFVIKTFEEVSKLYRSH